MTDVFPQLAGLDRFRDLAVCTADQFPICVFTDSFQERIGYTDRVVRVLAGNRCVSFRIPVGVVCGELDRGVALTRIVQNALDIRLGDRNLFRGADRLLQAVVDLGVIGIGFGAIPATDRIEHTVQHLLVHFRASYDGRNLLLFLDLPVDELFDIGVIRVTDHHLGRAARCAAGLDRASCAVTDLQEAHQTRGFATTGQGFALGPQG